MATFNILLSCMHQKDYSIIATSNIRCGAVVINQCDIESRKELANNVLWIDSTERGLSRSRNLAIKLSNADICLIADDDEVFVDECYELILQAYRELPEADLIVFDVENYPSKLKNKVYKLWKYETLRVASVNISFRRKAILENGIVFDTKLGAGSGNGAGEENKFLLDCYKKGLKIYHYPAKVATLKVIESTWFSEYNEDFFYKRGMVTRYYLGLAISCIYALYYVLIKKNIYKKDTTFFKAFFFIFKGIIENKLKAK